MAPKPNPATEKKLEELWGRLQSAIEDVNAVIRGEKSAVQSNNMASKMQWYTRVYEAATMDPGLAERLYRKLDEWIRADLDRHVTQKVQNVAKQGDSEFLFKYITKAYDEYRLSLQMGKIIFHYLDTYVAKRAGHHSIEKLYLMGFNKAVYQTVKKDLQAVIIRQVNSRRDGNTVDLRALKSAVGIFISVGTAVCEKEEERRSVYTNDIEQAYVDALHKFYSARARGELERDGGHYTFLQWVESRIDLELALAKELLSAQYGSIEKVHNACDEEMVVPHMRTVICHPDSGCAVLLEDWKDLDLARMYKVFKRVPNNEALNIMAEEMRKRVIVEGESITQAFSSVVSDGALSLEKPMVESVMGLNDKYGNLIARHFENHNVFQQARKKAFEHFLKKELTRKDQRPGQDQPDSKKTSFSEVLATFCDAVMRGDLKDNVDQDAENERLDKLVQIFSYIVEKDIFQEYYKSKLAKRLLQTTPNEDLERTFLEKLQRLMGKSFTHKMEGMLNDRETTRQHTDKFQNDVSSRGLPADFDVQVLTAGHWPPYRADTLAPPASLRQCIDAFARFYKKGYATRMLNWIHALGSCVLKVSFPKGIKDVTGSIYQGAILLILDETGTASPNDLAANLKLDVKHVKPHVASMYVAKNFQFLARVDSSGAALPPQKTVGDDEVFALNQDYNSKTRKLKLPPAPTAIAGGQAATSDPEIDARRNIQIDACTVRIMKSRRTLHYNELQDLIIQQLSKLFIPQPKMIKKRLEDLITRGYIKRDEDDPTKFDYLAV